MIVDACLSRTERLWRQAGEFERNSEALAKRGARVIASSTDDDAIRRAALNAALTAESGR